MARPHQPGRAPNSGSSCRKTSTGNRSRRSPDDAIGRAGWGADQAWPLRHQGQGAVGREIDAAQASGGPHLHGHVPAFSTLGLAKSSTATR